MKTLYKEFVDMPKRYAPKINADKNIKVILSYSIVLFDYAVDVDTLNAQHRYSSIIHMSRSLLECYAIIKKLLHQYPNPTDFQDFYNDLIVLDMVQDLSICKDIDDDNSIDATKRSALKSNYLQRLEKLLTQYFGGETIDQTDKEESIRKIILSLKANYDKRFDLNTKKNAFVEWALEDNKVWKQLHQGDAYEGSKIIYRSMCHFTHLSLSSIQERVVKAGSFCSNTDVPNNAAAMSLVITCAHDIYNELNALLS